MKVKLAYGKTGLDIAFPDELNVHVVEPKYVKALPDEAKAVRDALRQPIASKPLRELVRSSDRIGIVVNDITRPTPYHIILPVLLNELGSIADDQRVLFNATGTHRANTDAELRAILGDEIVGKYRIIQNDAHDRDSHTLVGTTTSGNDIWIHTEYVECDLRILTGFIEPHFFAGFSGGGKACMPGLALAETVLRNHSAKNIDNAMASWGITNGNPIWQEIQEAAQFTSPTFLLNVTLNRDWQVTGVFAGDLQKAHERGCEFARENAMAPVKRAYDIVITSNSGYPLDLNLYQSVKGMSAAAQIVKKGGSIIVAADCWDGIPAHGEYGRLLFEAESPQSLLQTVRTENCARQDAWQAQIQALVSLKADVYFYSRNLSEDEIERALLKPCHSIEATVNELLSRYGRKASICVLPEGPHLVMRIA